jgi:hypothetical protein
MSHTFQNYQIRGLAISEKVLGRPLFPQIGFISLPNFNIQGAGVTGRWLVGYQFLRIMLVTIPPDCPPKELLFKAKGSFDPCSASLCTSLSRPPFLLGKSTYPQREIRFFPLHFQRRIPETTKGTVNTEPRTIPAIAPELRCLCVARLCESVGEAPDAVVEVELEEGSGGEIPRLVVEIAFEEEGRLGDAVASGVVF